jgi:excisionase family DNA binding protein
VSRLAALPLETGESLLTVQDVAARLKVKASWVYVAAETGTLPSLKVGRYLRFEAEELEAYLEKQRQGPK